MKVRLLSAALLSYALLAEPAAAAADPARVYYDSTIRSALTGVYAHDGLLFVQVRTPYDDEIDTRTKSRLASIPVAAALLKQWCIDRAGRNESGAEPPPGMSLVRRLVLRRNPGWEYKDWKMDSPSREFVWEKDGFHSLCLVFSEKDVVDSIPESFSKPIPDERWQEALRETVPPVLKSSGALAFADEIGYAEYRDENSAYTKPFSRWDAADAVGLLQADLRRAMTVRPGNRGEDEYKELLERTARYLAESPLALGFLEDGKALSVESISTNITEKPLSTAVRTNIVVVVTTNAIPDPKTETSSVALPQARSSFADRHLSWKGLVAVDLRTTPCYVVTTQETTTIVRTIAVTCSEVEATARATPRFESVFLGGGFSGNRVAPRTPLGQSALEAFLRKGKTSEKERQLLSALRENPGDKELWNAYGRMLQKGGDWIGSTICFRSALSLDPGYEFALANLSESLAALGCRDLAIGTAIVGRSLATDPWCIETTSRILRKEDWK